MPSTLKQEIIAKAEEVRKLVDAHPTLRDETDITAGPKDFNKNWDKGWNKDGR